MKNVNADDTVKGEKPHGNIEFRDKDGNVLLTVEDIASVSVGTSENSEGIEEYTVNLTFTDEGSKKFADITTERIGESLGIYVEDELVSNPSIRTAITGGEAVIYSMDTYESAEQIVNLIQGTESDTRQEESKTKEDVKLKTEE